MADKKTSQEAAAAPLTGAELVRGVQSGGNVKITTAAIAALYTPTVAKGDIIARGTSADGRVAVGADGLQMVADSTQPQGIKWFDAIGAFAATLIANGGSALLGYLRAVTGSVFQTQQQVNDAFVRAGDFGIKGDNSTDNSTGLSAMAAYATGLTATATTCRVHFPAGIYKVATFPNLAIAGLHLDCAPGVIFKHTGTGVAMLFDGGASGAGVENVTVTGYPMVQGNAAGTTTICVDFRAFHRSRVQMAARDATTAGFRSRFAVCTDFDLRLSPIGQPAFVVAPTSGFLMDQRGTGEQTSACTLRNPIFEGVSGYGLNLASATQCEIIGGTSEANGGGIFISGSSTANTIRSLDCETNTTADVFCQGLYNRFVNVLSSTTSTMAGQTNTVVGGRWNTLLSSGIDNRFENVLYSTNAGSFTESGSGTIKRGVRNATTNLLDVDVCANPSAYLYIDGASGFGQVRGSADKLVVAGSANDTVDYKFGNAQHQFWVNNAKNFSLGSAAMGFYGATPAAQPGAVANTHTVTAGSTTAVFTNTSFDGGTGSTAYTVGDIVRALKSVNLIAQ